MRTCTLILLFNTTAMVLAAAPTDVVATVNGAPITLGEVAPLVQRKLATLKADDAATTARVTAEILQGLVDFRLLQTYFKTSPHRATDEDYRKALDSLRKQLAAKDPNLTIERLMATVGQTAAQFREELLIKISLNKQISSLSELADLEQFFNTHRAEFDGSELRVSHILLRPLQRATPEEIARLEAQAAAIRAEILAGKLTFAAAVEKYSQGPSRDQGGDLGWIRRDGPMLEQFNEAAFALSASDGSEISPPVITPFGVHLITRTGSTPGKKKLADVRPQVELAFVTNRASELMQQLYRDSKIEFPGKLPHYKPGTKELVLPE